jgi:hypothetical protein
VVADSCHDNNIWCRDSRYHLDLATASVEQFKAGLKGKFGNRMVRWHYIDAPNYQGDVRIFFRQNSQPNWLAISISNLRSGLHGVLQDIGGRFEPLKMDGDMGQSYVLRPDKGDRYTIRIVDANDQSENRTYTFSLAQTCGDKCSKAFTEVAYTVVEGAADPAGASAQEGPSQKADGGVLFTPAAREAAVPAREPLPSAEPTIGLRAELRIKSEWTGGYCADLVVINDTAQRVGSWSVMLAMGGAQLSQTWNLTVPGEGENLRVGPGAPWNSEIEAGEEMALQGFCAVGARVRVKSAGSP